MTLRPFLPGLILILILLGGAGCAAERSWSDEATWLVATVSEEILRGNQAGLTLGAVKALDDDGRSWLVTVQRNGAPQPVAIRLDHHLWAAEDYLPLARMRQGPSDHPAPPAAAPPCADLLEFARHPVVARLLAADVVLGRALPQQAEDAELREQAALLNLLLAWREAAGHFTDIRQELCAATAHLAVARCSRPVPGRHGQVADALLSALVGRQAEALGRLAGWPAPDPGLEPWRRTVQLAAQGDWRTAKPAASATAIEQIAYFRVLAQRIDSTVAATWWEEVPRVECVDWGRIISGLAHVSVANGHRFVHGGWTQEIAEITEVAKSIGLRLKDADDLEPVLTMAGADDPGRIIPARRWSAFLQRQMASRILAQHRFLAHGWGVPDQAAALRGMVGKRLAGMPLMNLVRMTWAEDPLARADCLQAAKRLTQDRPWIITTAAWLDLTTTCKETGGAGPDPQPWFRAGVLAGTVFDIRWRCLHPPCDEAQTTTLVALAPHDLYAARHLARLRLGAKPAMAALVQAYGPLADIDILAAREIAKAARGVDEELAAQRRLADLDPDCLVEVAATLVKAERLPEAVVAYEELFTKGRDPLRIAAHMEWLVRWHLDHGAPQRAQVIADRCGEVFSKTGLTTKGYCYERLGKWGEAEKTCQAIAERYQDSAPLMDFYRRNQDRDPSYRALLAQASAQVFPEGMQALSLADCREPPVAGVLVTSEPAKSRRPILRKGDIVVAVDGQRCATLEQFSHLQKLKPEGAITVIVWSGKAYREATATSTSPGRRLGVTLESWKAPAADTTPRL